MKVSLYTKQSPISVTSDYDDVRSNVQTISNDYVEEQYIEVHHQTKVSCASIKLHSNNIHTQNHSIHNMKQH